MATIKRSSAVPLAIVTGVAAALLGCSDSHSCVDETGRKVNKNNCYGSHAGYGGHRYVWAGGRPGGSANSESSGGTRGVIGSVGEAAAGHAGGGGGE